MKYPQLVHSYLSTNVKTLVYMTNQRTVIHSLQCTGEETVLVDGELILGKTIEEVLADNEIAKEEPESDFGLLPFDYND